MRIALDSNVLIYYAGVNRSASDIAKIATIRTLIDELETIVPLYAPVQTLGEMFVVLRRSGASADFARSAVLEFAEAFECPPSAAPDLVAALDLVIDHRMQLWDALILCAAAEAGCTILLSEDMQDGFVARGVTVVNPLAAKLHPKLAAVLALG
jgi:predicted nucleic acid-binding protein